MRTVAIDAVHVPPHLFFDFNDAPPVARAFTSAAKNCRKPSTLSASTASPSGVGTLLDREELVMAMVDGSKLVKWLDVPDGPMASGEAAFVTGHLKRANAGQRDQA